MQLTLIERYVLESLSLKKRNLEELSNDLFLNISVVQRVLSEFLKENIIKKEGDYYSIESLPHSIDVLPELNDLSMAINGLYFEKHSKVKLKKFFCTPEQQRYLHALMGNLESYIDGLSKQPCKTSEQQVLLIGQSQYAKIIEYDIR
jgi:hypothetical protein